MILTEPVRTGMQETKPGQTVRMGLGPDLRAVIRFAAIMIFLMGCRSVSPAATYYTLAASTPGATDGPSTAAAGLKIGIGPVQLPDYLDRLPLVTRSSSTRLKVNDTHRWAGPLDREIQRVLVENLAALTGARQVEGRPWQNRFTPDLRVQVNVKAFEGRPGGTVHLKATWILAAWESDKVLHTGDIAIEQPVRGQTLEAMVEAMSRALADLSGDMAAAILRRD